MLPSGTACPVPNNLLREFPLVIQRCNYVERSHAIGSGSSGDIVQIQVGYRRRYPIAFFIYDRIVDQCNVQIDPW